MYGKVKEEVRRGLGGGEGGRKLDKVTKITLYYNVLEGGDDIGEGKKRKKKQKRDMKKVKEKVMIIYVIICNVCLSGNCYLRW